MNLNGGDGLDLELLLERELRKAAGKLQGPSPRAAQSAYHAAFAAGGFALSPISSVLAFVSTKAAVAVAAATIVVGGAAAGTVATGSTNPTVWGQAVVTAVQGCKAAEAANDATASGARTTGSQASAARQNVGQCVSAFAKQHGAAERALHSKASAARTNHPTGKPSDHPGKPTDHPQGRPSDVPNGKPSDQPNGHSDNHPGGQPSGVPAGKPSSKPTE
jgi:beta-glucosidase